MSVVRFGGTCRCWLPWAKSIRSRSPTAISAAKRSSPTKPAANRATSPLSQSLGQSAMVAIHLFPIARMRTAHSAQRRQRLGRGAESRRLQSHVRPRRRRVHLRKMVAEFPRRASGHHQRPADVPDRQRRTARPRLSGRSRRQVDFEIGLTFSTRDPISYLEIIKNGQVAESDSLRRVCQKRQIAQSAFRPKRLVPAPRDNRRGQDLSFRHDRAVLRRNRLQAADQQKGRPVLPRLGLRAGKANQARRSPTATRSNRAAPQGPRLLARNALQGQRGIDIG